MSKSDQDIRNRLLLVRLPAAPQILLKLLELCQTERAGMAELAKLLARDANMTARVLKVANSAAVQRAGQELDLAAALSALGTDMVKTLLISESVLQTLGSFPHCSSRDLRRFWWHALTTAAIAREIAKAMDYRQTEEAYLAGLLHDVGRLALLAAAPEEYYATFHAQEDQNLCAAEQHSLQISHAEAGAWLVERWNLDSVMADAILYHHELANRVAGAHPLIRLLHLANQLADREPALPMAADAGALCQISGLDLPAITQGAAAQVSRAAEYLGMDLSGMADWAPVCYLPAPAEVAAHSAIDRRMAAMPAQARDRSQWLQLALTQPPAQQLLASLLKNAAEVLPSGRRIEIINHGAVQRGGRAVLALSVIDKRPGIVARQRSRLLLPPRYRSAGRHRGAGLRLVQGLVQQLGGSIRCARSRSGTRLELRLPLFGPQGRAPAR
jgi:putative nucleotidyltransferase with HDIG domain